MFKQGYQQVVSIILFLCLSGCSAFSGPANVVVSDPVAFDTLIHLQQETEGQRLPATTSLLKQFEKYWSQGKKLLALNALQRALQIQPADALIYYDMAVVRFSQKQYETARQLALLAQSYSKTDDMFQAALMLVNYIQTHMPTSLAPLKGGSPDG